MGQLNELQIKAAQPRDKEYMLSDGEGLYLRVRPNGKVWIYRYKQLGKQAKLSFGSYPIVTLAMARRKARDEAEKRAGGIDPRDARRDQQERDRVTAHEAMSLTHTQAVSARNHVMALPSKGGAALQSPAATFRETEGLSNPSSRRHNMPVIVCECKVGIAPGVKARIATELTSAIREIILSPLDLISVVFHEATPENTYRSGEPTSETLIFCHIRDGRSDGAVLWLAKKVSSIWSACTGAPEDEIEVLVALYPAKYVVRGGERLPEAPRV